MNHKLFIRRLGHRQRSELTLRTNRHAGVRICVLGVCLIVLSTLIQSRVPLWFLLLVPQGLLLVSLFHFLHECIHNTVFKSARANRIGSVLSGFVLFIPPLWFKYFHFAHHRYTQNPDKDPELETPKPITPTQWLLHISGYRTWKSLLSILVLSTLKPISFNYVALKARQAVRTEIAVMVFVYLLLLFLSVVLRSSFLLWIWFVPVILGQPFLRLYLLAEHTACEHNDNMFQNTRTVLTNPLVLWFTWNMPYHVEHHAYPGVPFHQLPRLHQHLKEQLEWVSTGYVAFNRSYARELFRTK